MKLFVPRHIRTRLTAAFVGVLAIVLLLYSAAAGSILLHDLRNQMVRYAIQDLETVEGLLYFSPDGQLLLRDDYHNHPESKLVLERLVEVRSPDGRVLLANSLLGHRSLGNQVIQNEGENGYSPRLLTLADGVRVQLVSRRHLIDGRPVIIRIAYEEKPLWDQLQAGLMALVLPLPLILSLAAVGGFLLASQALKPIETLARKAEAITSENLHERLPVNPSDGELADLARVFNTVLVRLEQSFEQLRRFTSDASHELRTPLAAMRSVGEVGLRKDADAAAYRDVIGSMLEEANQLTRLVDSLLAIARADARQVELRKAVFPAVDLARECVLLFEAVLDEGDQRLTLEAAEDEVVCGDWLLLRQALVNVVHNAIKYTPRGGAIVLRVIRSTATGQVIFEVEDTGPGIPVEALEKVFDRFFRADPARSREQGGAGLGLSIARWNVAANGGEITAHKGKTGGCLVRIALPFAATEHDARDRGSTLQSVL